MAIREVITGENDETLRKVCREVKTINKHILTLLDDMKDTLEYKEGAGLAAPQVGVLRRIAIVSYEDKYYELINPKIIKMSGEEVVEEGCLSLPDVWGTVQRPQSITVTYQDREGTQHTIDVTGIPVRIFCHEIDHLDGVLFVDKMIEELE